MNYKRVAALVCLFCFVTFSESSAQDLSEQLSQQSIDSIVNDVQTSGDAKRGASVFYREDLSCWRCHDSVAGRRLGPNLTEVRDVSIDFLIESLLKPSAKIREGFEQHVFQLDDGRLVSGIIVSEDEQTIQLDRIEEPGHPLQIEQETIENRRRSQESSMPTGLVNQLTKRQEFIDLIAYLKTIAEQGAGKAVQLQPAHAGMVTPLPAYESELNHRELVSRLDANVLKQGENIYRLRCASCHGDRQQEGSMPTSMRFASGKFKQGGDPFTMYQTLTHGFGLMIPQRTLVPQQKYAVIHYIRETFVKPYNPEQYVAVDDDYLAGLPVGESVGPEPKTGEPWVKMNYGPSFINTIEVPHEKTEPENIAQKGMVLRLDSGEGGVSAGNSWLMFDHDTMRMSAIWDGDFIDYNGIHFNGVHGQHPRVTGRVLFQNSDGPGWGNPETGGFDDSLRVEGRDGKKYGPLPRGWAEYKGMYRYGDQTVIAYTVDDVPVLESPLLQDQQNAMAIIRYLEMGPRKRSLVMQVSHASSGAAIEDGVCRLPSKSDPASQADGFNGQRFFEMSDLPGRFADGYTIKAKIKTEGDGTLLSFTRDQEKWLANGQSFFVRNGKLAFDIGWVGAVSGRTHVADGKWHDVQLNWNAKSGAVSIQVDGRDDGQGNLRLLAPLTDAVIRVGFTNDNFPQNSEFHGEMPSLDIHAISENNDDDRPNVPWRLADWESVGWKEHSRATAKPEIGFRFVACVDAENEVNDWLEIVDDQIRLNIPAGKEPIDFRIVMGVSDSALNNLVIADRLRSTPARELASLTMGGPANWPQKLETKITAGPESGGFVTDTIQLPENNPWNCRLRLSGIDFIPNSNDAIVCAWDGSVWKVQGIGNSAGDTVSWQRIAAGLFQPLGVKIRDGVIFVTCRDQLVALHDLNDDGETDWYQCFNNDHQVTPHFHEFAMGLQTDDDGNFYYAKSARHALKAVVPHHGTLLKILADGSQTEILANGFRAANGVCLNPDGSFVVTDQEGHWNPKNRINWVRPGEFYGNMFGYHNVTDESDEAMTPPLCWITNEFDRSPAELLWVESDKWGPLNGHLLNLSYGYGKAYVVPLEEVNGQMQGGMCAFDIPAFPTGIMRGRFRPADGQLYCCGLFAWSSTQETPGGLYRLRASGQPFHLPIELNAMEKKISVQFTEPLDPEAMKAENFAVKTWDLKRTANYGSDHYNEKDLLITSVSLSSDGRTVTLSIPDLKATWGMEIAFALTDAEGNPFTNKFHNSIYNRSPDRN